MVPIKILKVFGAIFVLLLLPRTSLAGNKYTTAISNTENAVYQYPEVISIRRKIESTLTYRLKIYKIESETATTLILIKTIRDKTVNFNYNGNGITIKPTYFEMRIPF